MSEHSTSTSGMIGLIMLACFLAVLISLFMGSGWRDPLSLLDTQNRAVFEIRLWRVIMGVIVGSSLAVSGALLQAVLRNPLAEPYVLGVSSGSGLGMVLCIVSGGLAWSIFAAPLCSFIGALLSLCIVYRLALVGRSTAPHTLLLSGVVWASICGSALMFIVSQSSVEGLHAIMWWFLGDLQVYDVRLAKVVIILSLIAFLVISRYGRILNVMTLGDEAASHSGVNPERARRTLLALASLLAASAVCVSGLIGFVGLVVPHIARGLVGATYQRVLPVAACLGAAFLTLADGMGRMIIYPAEVPVGVFTALIGGPFFLLLLRKKKQELWM